MEELKEEKKKKGLGKGFWISVALIVVVVFLLLVWDMVSGPIHAVIMSFLADWGFI